ncbi:ferritin, partial [Escherichia coli]
KTSIFSHPVYLFLRKFSLQDSRGGSNIVCYLHTLPRLWKRRNVVS